MGARFDVGVFLLLDGLPSQVDEPHLPEALAVRRQFHVHSVFETMTVAMPR